jgi:hypothetical protein
MGVGAGYMRLNTSEQVNILRSGTANIGASTVAVHDDAWHHVVWTKSGATNVIYIDGVDRTGWITDSTATNPTQLIIADETNALHAPFAGSIDEASEASDVIGLVTPCVGAFW